MSKDDALLLERLCAYLDDELSLVEKTEIEALLASSRDARRMLDELRRVSSALREAPVAPLPDALSSRIASALDRSSTDPRPLPHARPRRVLPIKTIASFAALAASVLVALVVMNFQDPSDRREQEPSPRQLARARVERSIEPAEEKAQSSADARQPPARVAESAPPAALEALEAESIDDTTARRTDARAPSKVARLRSTAKAKKESKAQALRDTSIAESFAAPGDAERYDRLAACPKNAPFLSDRAIPIAVPSGSTMEESLKDAGGNLAFHRVAGQDRPESWEIVFLYEDLPALEEALGIRVIDRSEADSDSASTPCRRITVVPRKMQDDSEH